MQMYDPECCYCFNITYYIQARPDFRDILTELKSMGEDGKYSAHSLCVFDHMQFET